MDDPCNVPYVMIFGSLVPRCGYPSDSKLHVCSRCQSIDLFTMSAKIGLVPSVRCALAYVMYKHRLNVQTKTVNQTEKIVDTLVRRRTQNSRVLTNKAYESRFRQINCACAWRALYQCEAAGLTVCQTLLLAVIQVDTRFVTTPSQLYKLLKSSSTQTWLL